MREIAIFDLDVISLRDWRGAAIATLRQSLPLGSERRTLHRRHSRASGNPF
jgi:hypothetical protein